VTTDHESVNLDVTHSSEPSPEVVWGLDVRVSERLAQMVRCAGERHYIAGEETRHTDNLIANRPDQRAIRCVSRSPPSRERRPDFIPNRFADSRHRLRESLAHSSPDERRNVRSSASSHGQPTIPRGNAAREP